MRSLKNSRNFSSAIYAVLFVAYLFAAPTIFAQIGGGSIVGNVFDPNQAAVPNAVVTAVELGTNKRQTANTNEDGYYEFPLLPAGRYTIEVEAANFQITKSQPFDLNTGTRPKVDLTLNVQGVNTEVTVSDSGQLVNATTTELGVVIDQRKIEALPLNGRNFIQLLDLQPGASSAPGGRVGGRGGFELNGGYTYGNSILVDGVDASFGENNGTANDRSAGSVSSTSSTGAIINTLSVDAIQEFKTTSNAFSAEFGRATSGVLNITTKSGTNDYHGTLLYFVRNNVFDANSFDNNNLETPSRARGIERPALRFNQYGGNIGGPIFFPAFGEGGPTVFNGKDKLFFFFNYEGARATRPFLISGANAVVPTQSFIARVANANLREYLRGFPSACTPIVSNAGVVNPDICNAFRIASSIDKENTFLGRVDGNFGAHRTSFRFSYNRQDYSQPQVPRVTNDFSFPLRAPNIAVQDSWTLSNNIINEFRFGYNKVSLRRNNAEYFTQVGWAQVNGVLPGDNQSLIDFRNKTYSVVDNVTYVRGKQTIKTGIDVRFLRSGRIQDTNPTTFFNTLNDLADNKPATIRLTFGGEKALTSNQFGVYIQDDIRVNNRLQINPGLRYEYYTPLKGGFNIQSSDPFSPLSTTRNEMFRKDKNNFGPRLGVVYDVFGTQKLVLRGGAAVSFQPPQPIYFYDHAFADPRLPFNASFFPNELPPEIRNAGFPYNRAFSQAILANPSLLPANQILPRLITDYNRSDEYGLLFNATAQYAVNEKLAVQVGYTGTRSLNHPVVTLPNERIPIPGPGSTTIAGPRPRPEYGSVTYVQSVGRIRYDAMQISVNERFSRNISADFYYTYAKSFTYGNPDEALGNDQTFLQNPTDIGSSFGPKSTDVRHRVAFSHTVEIPLPQSFRDSRATNLLLGGISIQGIYTFRTGQPLNVFAGLDLTRNGRANGSRPNLVPGVDPYLSGVTGNGNTNFLNPAAFDRTTPFDQRRYGNLGYNALRGPTFWNYDLSLVKSFRISESQRFDIRVEAFNVLNHANYLTIETSQSLPDFFGQVTSRSNPRNIQFGLKYFF